MLVPALLLCLPLLAVQSPVSTGTQTQMAVGCMEEREDVDMYHVYKAHAATNFTHGEPLQRLDTHPHILQVEKENADGSTEVIHIDTSASDCELPESGRHLFFLHPSGSLELPGGTSVEVFAPAAKPTELDDRHRQKFDKIAKKSLCQDCSQPPRVKKIHRFPEHVTVWEDSSFTEECKMRGDPQPHMYWLFNNQPITADLGVRVEPHWKRNVLRIDRVEERHAGNYTCVGTNFKDEPAYNTFELIVRVSNVDDCDDSYNGFCMNGGTCFKLVRENVHACYCPKYFVGDRCQYYDPFSASVGNQSGDTRMVPLANVLIICAGIVAAASVIMAATCLCIAYSNERRQSHKRRQVKLQQSFDYNNRILPSQISHESANLDTKPFKSTHLNLTNSFIKGTRSVNKYQPANQEDLTPATGQDFTPADNHFTPPDVQQNERRLHGSKCNSESIPEEPAQNHLMPNSQNRSRNPSRNQSPAVSPASRPDVDGWKLKQTSRNAVDLSDDDVPSPMSISGHNFQSYS